MTLALDESTDVLRIQVHDKKSLRKWNMPGDQPRNQTMEHVLMETENSTWGHTSPDTGTIYGMKYGTGPGLEHGIRPGMRRWTRRGIARKQPLQTRPGTNRGHATRHGTRSSAASY